MRKLKVLILVLFIGVISFATTIKGRVIKVSDGDTITLLKDNNKKVKIRFYGIDAPEKTQEYGIKSLDSLRKLIDNKTVEVEVKDKDRYGRFVGVVYYNNLNVNLNILEKGDAWWYREYSKGNLEFSNAEKKAREEKLGLWKEGNPTPPWEYRRRNRSRNIYS